MKKEILQLDNKPREISKPVESIDDETIKVVKDLLETLRTSERPGVGLAAPQIGENVRIVVIESSGWENDKGEIVGVIPTSVLINPVFTKKSEEKHEAFEGCLSVPDVGGYVERSKKVKVEATNEKGEKVCIKTSGFFARVLQHEIDHLDGILFIDVIKDKTKIVKLEEEVTENEK